MELRGVELLPVPWTRCLSAERNRGLDGLETEIYQGVQVGSSLNRHAVRCHNSTGIIFRSGKSYMPSVPIRVRRGPSESLDVLLRAVLPPALRVAAIDGQSRTDPQLRLVCHFRGLIPIE